MNNQLNWKLLGLAGMMLWPLLGAAQVNLDSGLVAYYPFNGNANDESGNGRDGTVFGATLTSNRFGVDSSAYNFDGIDDYINIPSLSLSPILSNNFSVAVWFKSDQIQEPAKIITKGTNVGFPPRIIFDLEITLSPVSVGNFPGQIGVGLSNVALLSTDTVSVNRWNFVVMVYDDSIGELLYLNNKLQDSSKTLPVNFSIDGYLQIGREDDGGIGVDEFDGVIDDIRIYSKALNFQEIDSLYNKNLNSTDIAKANNLTISLYPNPAPGIFTLRSPQAAIQSLTLYDLAGRRLPVEISHDRHEAQVRSSYRGLAIVKIQTDQGVWVQKMRME